jgi:hypothetical protein
MKVVPYIYTQSSTDAGLKIHKINVFLSRGGSAIWQTDETGPLTETFIQEEYLIPNGLISRSVRLDQTKGIAWIEVDTDKTKLSDFYTWAEVLKNPTIAASKPECWRPYYFFVDADQNDWWTPRELSVEAEVQDLGNSSILLKEITSNLRS